MIASDPGSRIARIRSEDEYRATLDDVNIGRVKALPGVIII